MAQDTLLGFPAHILPYRFLDSLRQGKHLPFRPVLTSFWKGALLVEKRIDRVIFTCGGTAGHVNPAIAVAQLMAEKNPQIKILFVGAERGLEKDLIPKAGYEFRTVHISSFHRSLKLAEIKHNLVSLYNMVRSPAEARAILKEFRPDAVIGTGGYASYPTVKAAAKMGIPTAVHESNAVPGLTTELLEPYAGRIMVGFESCRQHYKHPEKVAVTGTPVREDFFTLTKEAAKEKLGVNDGRPLIVSFWGSLGASGKRTNGGYAGFGGGEGAVPSYPRRGQERICCRAEGIGEEGRGPEGPPLPAGPGIHLRHGPGDAGGGSGDLPGGSLHRQ